MTDDDLFRNAVSLVPDSFFADIENDAREQGFQSVMLTTAGTGLRWIRANHHGRSTESPEESAMVRCCRLTRSR